MNALNKYVLMYVCMVSENFMKIFVISFFKHFENVKNEIKDVKISIIWLLTSQTVGALDNSSILEYENDIKSVFNSNFSKKSPFLSFVFVYNTNRR